MGELKTQKTGQSVSKFIAAIQDSGRRKDCEELVALMSKLTKSEPKMWGDSIVGFGEYHYVYASGREGDWPLTGFSPRKQYLSIYLSCDLAQQPAIKKSAGKFKMGKSCLYVDRLADIDRTVLVELIKSSIAFISKKYNSTPGKLRPTEKKTGKQA